MKPVSLVGCVRAPTDTTTPSYYVRGFKKSPQSDRKTKKVSAPAQITVKVKERRMGQIKLLLKVVSDK